MGVFDRVRPYEDFFRVRTCDGRRATGRGAWEVAYRFSYIDMLDGLTTEGGRPGHRPHLRPELVSEPVYPGDVQLRPFASTRITSRPNTPHHGRKHGHLRDAVRHGFLTTPWERLCRSERINRQFACRHRNGIPLT